MFSLWTCTGLMNLRELIVEFKALGKSVFKVYQLSEMGTQKLHLLDEFGDVVRYIEGIKFLHGGLCERSRKKFETLINKNSKRRNLQWMRLCTDMRKKYIMITCRVEKMNKGDINLNAGCIQ